MIMENNFANHDIPGTRVRIECKINIEYRFMIINLKFEKVKYQKYIGFTEMVAGVNFLNQDPA
jgi:hypothetical protein